MIVIGILGSASNATRFFDRPLDGVAFGAVASRDPGRARAFASSHNVPRSYGSYNQLLNDPAIDAVYIPLPQSLHAEYVIKAAQAGKHVIVEKPAALTTAEIDRMEEAVTRAKVFFMEGLMYRFKHLHRRVLDIVQRGLIGAIRYVDFNWCFNIHMLNRSQFRLDPQSGGGALNDVGIYGVDFVRFLTGHDCEVIDATMIAEEPGGVDMMTHLSLRAGGVLATITVGYTCDANSYTISGDSGSLHVPGSVSGRVVDNILSMHVLGGDKRSEELFPAENPYAAEMEYFGQCIAQGRAPAPGLRNCRQNLAILEQCRASARILQQTISPGRR